MSHDIDNEVVDNAQKTTSEIEKENMSEDDLIGLINFDDLLNFEEAFDLGNVEGNFEDLINVEGNGEDLINLEGNGEDLNDTNKKEKMLEIRIEMLEEQIKRIVNDEKEGENEETRRAELLKY